MHKINLISSRIAGFPYFLPSPLPKGSHIPLKIYYSSSISTINPAQALINQLFFNHFEAEKPLLFRVLRKKKETIIHCIELLKVFFDSLTQKNESETYPARYLQVPELPHPLFRVKRPARFFDSPPRPFSNPHLLRETQEEEPKRLLSSSSIYKNFRLPLFQIGFLVKRIDNLLYLKLSRKCTSLLGNHSLIPVMMSSEYERASKWGEVKEIGQPFAFEITGYYSIEVRGLTRHYLTIESAKLEALREQYRLPARIQTHPFHIEIGNTIIKETTKQEPEIFRLNVSCFAA